MARRLATSLALIALSACSGGSEPAPDDASVQPAATPVEAFFRFGTVPIGATRAGITERWGAPDSVQQRVQANVHDAAITDSIFTLHYPGLAAEIYRASFDGRELLRSLVIADARWLAQASPLQLGMASADVQAELGTPDDEATAELFYACASCTVGGPDMLELSFEDGRLARIRVQYWLE